MLFCFKTTSGSRFYFLFPNQTQPEISEAGFQDPVFLLPTHLPTTTYLEILSLSGMLVATTQDDEVHEVTQPSTIIAGLSYVFV